MTRQEQLSARFITHLLHTAKGRAHVLNQLADAEDSDEVRIFEILLSKVDDPQLAKMIGRHMADEKRHAEMFRECVARQGVAPGPVPEHLKLLPRLDRRLGGLLDREITDGKGIMQAYVLLQVIEERAVTQFAMFEPVFERFDPLTARVLAEIGRDEVRHLKYCHAIARRYAPSAHELAQTLEKYRTVEALAFAETSLENLKYTVALGLVEMNPLELLLYRGISEVAARTGGNRTRFFGDAPERVDTTLAMAA